MFKDLLLGVLDSFDKDHLFIESTKGDVVLNDFTIALDKDENILIQGFEYDPEWEEKTENVYKFKIPCNKISDYENSSRVGLNEIWVIEENYKNFSKMCSIY